MKLGTIWNQCVLIYKDGKTGGLPKAMWKDLEMVFQEYLLVYPEAKNYNCWFDLQYREFFSGAQFRGGPGKKDHHFKTDKDDFLLGQWGISFVEKSIGKIDCFNQWEVQKSEEIIYSKHPDFKKYKGKSVLIVLGGPSTNLISWEKLEVDYIWTCNKFFRNPKLSRIPFDLITLAPDVDLSEPELIRYLGQNETLIAFEAERGSPWNYWGDTYKFLDRFSDNCLFYHTRYDSVIGIGPRFICFAAELKFSDIYFVGLDGVTAEGPRHAFEPGKKNPGWYHRYGDWMQNRHFIIFWDHLLNTYSQKGICFHNLGEEAPHNLSREISLLEVPLSSEIRQQLDLPKFSYSIFSPSRLNKVKLYLGVHLQFWEKVWTSSSLSKVIIGLALLTILSLSFFKVYPFFDYLRFNTTITTHFTQIEITASDQALLVSLKSNYLDSIVVDSLTLVFREKSHAEESSRISTKSTTSRLGAKLAPGKSLQSQFKINRGQYSSYEIVLNYIEPDSTLQRFSMSLDL